MATWLNAVREQRADLDRGGREVVEATLADIETRRDAAVRGLSIKFDK